LLVALIPGLLMLATVGLQRLESRLDPNTVSSTDVAKFFEHAEPSDVSTLARDGMSRALDGLWRRQHGQQPAAAPVATATASAHGAGLPTRLHAHHASKTEFQPTRHANRV
jgi:hypothetical protein